MAPSYFKFPEGQTDKISFDELHHYTSLAGLTGIISTRSLWATSFRYLNDATELSHLDSYLADAIAPAIDSVLRKKRVFIDIDLAIARHKGPRAFSRVLARNFIGGLATATTVGLPSIRTEPFVTSFCNHQGDTEYERANGLLSQWRGYGLNNGVAIVFDTRELRDWMNNENERFRYIKCSMSPVFYNNGRIGTEEKFDWLISLIAKFADEIVGMHFNTTYLVTAVFERIWWEYATASCNFKHRGFSEEREVRMVFLPLLVEGASGIKPVHTRGEYNIRYISLGELPVQSVIRRIIIGPSANQKSSFDEVIRITDNRINVVLSETPLIR